MVSAICHAMGQPVAQDPVPAAAPPQEGADDEVAEEAIEYVDDD
jgi:hypothetical protein